MVCRCNFIADELRRTLNPQEICRQNKEECNCCQCQKNVAKGKFGLAFIVETPRRKYTQPSGWEVEFEDTPSNISYNCKKMTQWANRPPIGECLETDDYFCCQSIEVRKVINNKEKTTCNCDQCVVKNKAAPCVYIQEPQVPACSCRPKMCSRCYTKLQELQNCNCNVDGIFVKQLQKGDQECLCDVSPVKITCKKHCKCKYERKYTKRSPERGECSCSKPRSKSRRKKTKQRSCECDDLLDYIPRKETFTNKENRSRERGRNRSRENICKLNSCDGSCNRKSWKYTMPCSCSVKSVDDSSYRNTRLNTTQKDIEWDKTRLDTEFTNTQGETPITPTKGDKLTMVDVQLNSIRDDSKLKKVQGEVDNTANSTQQDTAYNDFQKYVPLSSSRKESLEPRNETTNYSVS